MLQPSDYRVHMKSVTVNTTLLKSITVLHQTDFTPMGCYQLNLIQMTYYRKTLPQSSLKQYRYFTSQFTFNSWVRNLRPTLLL